MTQGLIIDSFYEIYLLKVYTHMSDYTTPLAWKYILGGGVERLGGGGGGYIPIQY